MYSFIYTKNQVIHQETSKPTNIHHSLTTRAISPNPLPLRQLFRGRFLLSDAVLSNGWGRKVSLHDCMTFICGLENACVLLLQSAGMDNHATHSPRHKCVKWCKSIGQQRYHINITSDTQCQSLVKCSTVMQNDEKCTDMFAIVLFLLQDVPQAVSTVVLCFHGRVAAPLLVWSAAECEMDSMKLQRFYSNTGGTSAASRGWQPNVSDVPNAWSRVCFRQNWITCTRFMALGDHVPCHPHSHRPHDRQQQRQQQQHQQHQQHNNHNHTTTITQPQPQPPRRRRRRRHHHHHHLHHHEKPCRYRSPSSSKFTSM